MSRTNEKRYIEWHETCKCKCRLDASVCKNKQRWNSDKCRRECKEVIDKGICDKAFIWNPSNCECECDKSCDVGEYLDYENCKCRKRLIYKLVKECIENIDEIKFYPIKTISHACSSSERGSCTVYIVLFSVFLSINIGIGIVFFSFFWYSRNEALTNTNSKIETTLY